MGKRKSAFCILVCLIAVLAFAINYKKPSEIKASYMPSTYEGLTCVKIIRESSHKELESQVNKFIKNRIVLDIDYGVGASNNDVYYSCCIHYVQFAE